MNYKYVGDEWAAMNSGVGGSTQLLYSIFQSVKCALLA